jgi:hypothetical protein
MLKRHSSRVLTSLGACDVQATVRLGASLIAALLERPFEHPHEEYRLMAPAFFDRVEHLSEDPAIRKYFAAQVST